jgi:hypothetical protein
MRLQKIWNKYIEEPAAQRKHVDISIRLSYSGIEDTINYKKYFVAFVLILALSAVLYFMPGYVNRSFLSIPVVVSSVVFYLCYHRYRKCKTCKQNMIRQVLHNRQLYFFCDKCRTKIDTGISYSGV